MEATKPKEQTTETTPIPPPLFVKKSLHKDFNRNQIFVTLGIIIATIGVIFIFLIPVVNAGLFVTIGVLQIIIGFQTPLKFREDHFIFKGAPASSMNKVTYDAIKKIDYEKKKIVVHANGKEIAIVKGLFDSTDWADIVKLFKSIKS